MSLSRRPGQAGTSVLAALVFVAIFVLFISGYKIASQSGMGQSAAVAGALNGGHTCLGGELYTVNMSSGVGSVESLKCTMPDPRNPSVVIPGPDAARAECTEGVQGKCAVRYCPPDSYVNESGTCFVMTACDPTSEGNGCLNGSIQNATQAVQAASIIAAKLLDDKGDTDARVQGMSEHLALAENLSKTGRSAVAGVINATADAAAEENLDAGVIRDVAKAIEKGSGIRTTARPLAQLSCQPKTAQAGMNVAIAFGCANSTRSSSNEFSTGGKLWGATQVRIDPTLPNGTMTYGLTCSDGARISTATCEVIVQKPLMLFSSQTGAAGTVSLAWVTRAMDQCVLGAKDNAALTAQFENPIPQSGALTATGVKEDDSISLTCTTVAGEVKVLTVNGADN